MTRRSLFLTEEQRQALEQARDTHPKPHVRERAGALLKIAQGQAAHAVARQGLLKARKPDTVYDWLNAFQQTGLAALEQRPRHSKRGFSPSRARRTHRASASGSAAAARN